MTDKQTEELVTIVIAEDDDGHARLIEERLSDAGVLNPMVRLRDGMETLNFFFRRGSGPQAEEARGYLLLLDIKMPGLDGIRVLKQLKQDEKTKTLPVVMLTTTDDPRDIETCYKAGCNNYLTKPVAFPQFADVIRRLGLFISVMKVVKR